jgi:hypothetical protein
VQLYSGAGRKRGNKKIKYISFFKIADTHIHMSTQYYEHTRTQLTSISTSKKLNWLNPEIHEVDHKKKHLTIEGGTTSNSWAKRTLSTLENKNMLIQKSQINETDLNYR